MHKVFVGYRLFDIGPSVNKAKGIADKIYSIAGDPVLHRWLRFRVEDRLSGISSVKVFIFCQGMITGHDL